MQMEKMRTSSAIVIIHSFYQSMKNAAQRKLVGYCNKRMIDLGLVPRTLKHEFYLGMDINTSRKTIGKLKSIFNKHLIKLIPYLSFLKVEFLQVENRDNFKITLDSPYISYDFREFDWASAGVDYRRKYTSYETANNSSLCNAVLATMKRLKWVLRYERYLNYICRKHYIPIRVKAERSLRFHSGDSHAAYSLLEEAQRKAEIRHCYVISFSFFFVAWKASDEEYHNTIRENPSPETDEFYSTGRWTHITIMGNRGHNLRESYRYSPVKLFMHLDKIIKVFTTLSRKAYYESPAYEFKSKSDS
jgi:hypothetical protein